jgi:hypothetical protein
VTRLGPRHDHAYQERRRVMSRCLVVGCTTEVTKEGHKLCLPHWRANRDGSLRECERCSAPFDGTGATCPACAATASKPDAQAPDDALLSATKIGERLGLSSRKVNLILSELGWIERYVKGWVPTAQGGTRGAVRREIRQSGVPYVVWPRTIVEDRILLAVVRELEGKDAVESLATAAEPSAATPSTDPGAAFRAKFPAPFRTADGHFVRSRAELLIDNWLYTQGIAHAYERRLPIEEDVYCDFYLPAKRVYVEYWGMEKDAKYAERKARKIAVYAKHELQLVELTDDDIANVDEALPRKLLKFGIECD